MTTGLESRRELAVQLRPITLRSAVKRALLGIVILVVTMGGVAWLTYASIEPDSDREETPKAATAPAKMTREVSIRL